MTEIDSRNINFLEDEFPTIGEIKKDVALFELQQDIEPSFDEGENLNSNQVTEDGLSLLSKGSRETYLLKRMRFTLNLQWMKRVNL